MKFELAPIAMALGLAMAGAASAEPYVDYTPQKGVWEIRTLKVTPNYVDDYLTALKRQHIVVLEVMKKHGIIDQYQVLTRLDSGAGVNVIIMEHYPDLSLLQPDKARDQMIAKEVQARTSTEEMKKISAEFDNYRVYETDDFWTPVDYPH
jgi:hypothetical protein